MTNEEIIELFHSNLSLQEVRDLVKVRHYTIKKLWVNSFGAAAFEERKRLKYRNSKLGNLNPMTGKLKGLHPNWKVSISTSYGYERVHAPNWFEGAQSGGLVHSHIINYCASREMKSIPKGFVIHHLDLDKNNNAPNNLIMLTNADHSLLHAWITRIVVQRLSRKGVEE